MSHTAADDDGINLVNHVGNNADLVRNLRAANDSNERTLRSLQSLADEVDLLLHQEACYGLQILGNANIGCMSAVGNTESIVYSNVSQSSQLLCKLRIILLFFLVITEILKKQDLTRLQISSSLLCLRTYTIRCPLYILLEYFGKPLEDVLGGELVLASLRWTADVAGENNSSTLLQQVGYGRNSSLNTGIVGDVHVLIERNIVVNTAEYLFTLQINVFNGFLVHIHEKILPPLK